LNGWSDKCVVGRCAWTVIALVIFGLGGGLTWELRRHAQPPSVNAERAEFRRKNLAELRAANDDVLNHYALLDAARGTVRLPIAEAMKIAEAQWRKDPAAARANLISREEKAIAPLPNKFE
jgi:hypothetical protein